MKTHHSAIVVIISLVLSTAVLLAQDSAKLVNNWVFGRATLTDRAEYVAYTQRLLITEARKRGMPPAQIEMIIRQVEAQITEQSINRPLQGSRMNFKDDHSVSVFVTLPTGEVRAAATWTLKGNELTIISKGVGPGASDSTQAFELVSVSKSQLVLKGHGLTQTYISND